MQPLPGKLDAGTLAFGTRMSIRVAIQDDLVIRLPQFFCCNCGEAEDIRSIATPLNAPRHRLWDSQPTLHLEFPYCRRCASSAKRKPVGPIKKALIAALLALSVGLITSLVPLPGLPELITTNIFYLSTAAVLAIVFGCYALQKPKDRQTSYHQPMRVTHLKRESSGRIATLTLSFTHARYGQAFAHANKEDIERRVLRVEGAG